MIKVQVLYKLSMYETDWNMTEEEYSEFIASTQGLPRPMLQKSDPVLLEDIPWHGAKTPTLAKEQQIEKLKEMLMETQDREDELRRMNDEIETEVREKDEIIEETKEHNGMLQMDKFILQDKLKRLEKDLEAMNLKAKGMVEKQEWKDFPNTIKMVPSDEGIDMVFQKDVEIVPIVPETMPTWITEVQRFAGIVQEPPKKVKIEPDDKFKAPISLNTSRKKTGRQGRDYEKHIKMMDGNDPVNDIVKAIMEDFNLTKAAAQSTYNNVKRTHERRKINQNMAESKEKVSVIPSNPVTIVKPSNSKIPRNLREEIACMPEYDNPINFKDAIITREYCNLYDIATLKAYYKETHENIKW